MRNSLLKLGMAVGLTMLAQGAWAQMPHGTLEFITPTATVGQNDAIPVWVRLTVDADSPALDFSSYPLTGFAGVTLPTQGVRYDASAGANVYADFAQVNGAYVSAFMNCTTSFSCTGTAADNYSFEFGSIYNANVPGIVYQDHLSVASGQSYDYLFGQFTPKAGGATAGTYEFSMAQMTVQFTGVDANGNFLTSVDRYAIAQSCGGGGDCGFMRTVVAAVPEPSSHALLALGLALVGLAARKKVRRQQ